MSEPIRVLLTNDDGFHASGMTALRRAFTAQPNVEVFVAAPDRERSTCSHGMTLGRPMEVTEVEPGAFAVNGLPADCVFLAQNTLLRKTPDVVISGINRGANLGSDVIFSGTVAGARQAFLMGMHGIAVSLTEGEDYTVAAEMTVDLAVRIAAQRMSSPILLNLNFPKNRPDGIRYGVLGRRRYPQTVVIHPATSSGLGAFEIGGPDVQDALIPGTDGWLVSQNIASATLLSCDQSDLNKMKAPFYTIEGIAPLQQDEQ